jgi:hypothetical protein
MFIYNDVKISICICGDMADLPQYVLLTMEGIELDVPVVHYLLCMCVSGVLSVRLCLAAPRRSSARAWEHGILSRTWKDGRTTIHYGYQPQSTAQGLCSLGSAQAYRHGIRFFGASVSRW